MSISYGVVVEHYAERHFISTFRKKYKGAWDKTWSGLVEEFRRIDTLIGATNIAEVIVDRDGILICKTEFRVAGTQESRHSSGNRCIIAVHKNSEKVSVLLVYHKGDLRGPNETAAWKGAVRENFEEYVNFF